MIQTIRIFSEDIEMKFGIEKCATLIMRKGKRETIKEIELSNQESSDQLEEKNYKYLGILQVYTIKQ